MAIPSTRKILISTLGAVGNVKRVGAPSTSDAEIVVGQTRRAARRKTKWRSAIAKLVGVTIEPA